MSPDVQKHSAVRNCTIVPLHQKNKSENVSRSFISACSLERELDPFQINYILKVNKERIKRERYEYDQEACSMTVSPPPPSLFWKVPEWQSARENRGDRKRGESYQCMNLITTQMAPHNEEKVDGVRDLHNSFCFSHLKPLQPPRRRSVFSRLAVPHFSDLWSIISFQPETFA